MKCKECRKTIYGTARPFCDKLCSELNKLKEKKTKKCAYCGKEEPIENFEFKQEKTGEISSRHKNCTFKMPI